MKEVFSDIVTIDKSTSEVFDRVKNPENLGKFLVNDVPDTYLPQNIKEYIKYGKDNVTLDVPGFKARIDLAEITSKHVKYNICFPGLKEGVIFIQILPTENGGSKMRLAAGYSLGIGPAGLLLRSTVNENKVKETLDDIAKSLEESFKVTEMKEED